MVDTKTKKAIFEMGKGTCEICKKEIKIEEVNIHRIRRGSDGGDYHWRNCMLLCKDCHKEIHYGEFN